MGRLINAIRSKLRRGRKNQSRPTISSDHASLKSNVNELREQLSQLFSRQQQLTELMSDMTEQLKGIVSDVKEGFKTVNSADKIPDLVKEVRKDISLRENDDTSGEGSDGTIMEDAASCFDGFEEELSASSSDSEEEHSCSDDSEEELSCSDISEDELSCSVYSEEELSCSDDCEEELSYSGDSEEELSCSGDSVEELSYSGDSEEEHLCSGDSVEECLCSVDSENEPCDGEHSRTGLERECNEEDSFRILTNQLSSDESVQKIDAAEAAERKRLWEEEIKAYYDKMLRERPELFYPVYYNAPQHHSAWQASSSSFAQPQVSSQEYYASGHPIEGSDEPQQSLEQEDQCIQGENESLTMMSVDSEEKLSQSNGDLLSNDNTSCRKVEEGSYVERECSEEDSFRILTNQSSSDESVQKKDAAEAAERKWLWDEETKAYYDRMLRERPELFYPVYYIAPQHYSAWQASSSSFAQPQVSSQEYYASGTANVSSCGCHQCCKYYHGHAQQSSEQDQFYVQNENNGITSSDHFQMSDNTTQFSFGTNNNRVLDEKCEHDTSELQPSIGDMGETVYAEYNMWSVQRIVE